MAPERYPAICVLILAAVFTCGCRDRQTPPVQTIAEITLEHPLNYRLDDAAGTIALYPGVGYRGLVDPKDIMRSLEALERRVESLPRGARLHYVPFKRDQAGRPFLFAEGQFAEFEKFCRGRDVMLLIPPMSTTDR